MEARDRTSLYTGYGDTMSRAIEFVMTPLVLAGLGYLLDRAVGTRPLFTAGLAALGAVGMFLRTWFAYVEAMKAEEARGPWRRT